MYDYYVTMLYNEIQKKVKWLLKYASNFCEWVPYKFNLWLEMVRTNCEKKKKTELLPLEQLLNYNCRNKFHTFKVEKWNMQIFYLS